MNHFHLSGYLIVPEITSYDQKPSWGEFFYRPRYVLFPTKVHFMVPRYDEKHAFNNSESTPVVE